MSYDDKTGVVTLQINQIGPGDEGEYTCSAKNQYGRLNNFGKVSDICRILISIGTFDENFRRSNLLGVYSTGRIRTSASTTIR